MATSWAGVSKESASWASVSAESATWVEIVQSGTVAAQFELNEPLGGPVWASVTQDG